MGEQYFHQKEDYCVYKTHAIPCGHIYFNRQTETLFVQAQNLIVALIRL